MPEPPTTVVAAALAAAWATLHEGRQLRASQRDSLAGFLVQELVEEDIVAICCALVANGRHEDRADVVALAIAHGQFAARAEPELWAAIALRHAQWLLHTRQANEALAEAAALGIGESAAPPRRLAGALALTSAVAEARLGEEAAARIRLDDARRLAVAELGDDPWHTEFSPANTDVHRIAVLAALGDRDEARAVFDAADLSSLSPERRARAALDAGAE